MESFSAHPGSTPPPDRPDASHPRPDFQALLEYTADFVAAIDGDGTIRYASAPVTRVLGYEPGELVGRRVMGLVHPEDAARAEAALAEWVTTGNAAAISLRYRHADGGYRMLETLGRNALRDPGVNGLVLSMCDATNYAGSLELSETHFRDLVQYASDAVYFCNRDFRIVNANDAACRLFGYPRDELLGMHLTELIDADDLKTMPLRVDEMRSGNSLSFDRIVRRKDGTRAHAEVNVRMLPNGLVQAIARDVTERRRLEQAVRESEQRLRLATRMVDLVAYTQDRDLRFTWIVNPQIVGDARQVIGRTDAELLCAADAARIVPLKQRVIETGVPARQEISITAGNAVLYFDLFMEPLKDEGGQIQGLTAVALNITERRRAEQSALARLRLAETVFRHSVSCLAILDRNYNFIRVNAAYAAACRRKMEDFPGHNRFELFPSAEARLMFDEVLRSKLPVVAFAKEYTFPDQPDRGKTYWDWTLVPVLDQQGEVEYLVFSLNDVTSHKRAELEAREARLKLKTLSTRLLEIQEVERADISRELHAEIGQALTAVRMQLLRMRQRKRTNTEPLDECIRITGSTLDQVRDLSLNLRPPHLDHFGITETLRWLLQRQALVAGWSTRITADPLPRRLAPETEIACFRIAQEALTNTARHAQAKNVAVRLRVLFDSLDLSVCDDGVGFDAEAMHAQREGKRSLGIISMSERAALVGGNLKIEKREKGGMKVSATLPLRWREPFVSDADGPLDNCASSGSQP